MSPDVALLTGGTPGDPVLDIALTHALLREVAAGRRGPALRIFSPGPTLAFGRSDVRSPGFARAAAIAAEHGLTPVVRVVGGRAAASGAGCLVVEDVTVEPATAEGLQRRFDDQTGRLVAALTALGAAPVVGELPGEYCPGRHSIHAGGVKLVGIAQRVVAGAALTSAVIVVTGGAALREVIAATYAALGDEIDPATVGALDEVVPGATVPALAAAIERAYAADRTLVPAPLDDMLLAAAEALRPQHLPPR